MSQDRQFSHSGPRKNRLHVFAGNHTCVMIQFGCSHCEPLYAQQSPGISTGLRRLNNASQ